MRATTVDKKQELNKASNELNENRDCTVRAVAVACDVPYKVAHKALADQGRKPGQGSSRAVWLPAVTQLGCYYEEVIGHFEAKTLKTLEDEMRRKYPGHKFMVMVYGHLLGFDGKEIIDWSQGRLHRPKQIFHVTKNRKDLLPEKKHREVEVVASDLPDVIFLYDPPHRNEYRIMIRENGKVRWLNTKYDMYDAEEAAERAAGKRWISFIGLRELDEVEVD